MEQKKRIRTAIIDDEPFVRADLKYLLSSFKQIEVTWEGGTFKEGQNFLKKNAADLVFLDIRLRGGSGLDLIHLIDQKTTRLILITAHEKYLDTRLKDTGLDFILKPVSPDLLSRMIHPLI